VIDELLKPVILPVARDPRARVILSPKQSMLPGFKLQGCLPSTRSSEDGGKQSKNTLPRVTLRSDSEQLKVTLEDARTRFTVVMSAADDCSHFLPFEHHDLY
jgi:hypothetical protein